jgi:hypothetical protein
MITIMNRINVECAIGPHPHIRDVLRKKMWIQGNPINNILTQSRVEMRKMPIIVLHRILDTLVHVVVVNIRYVVAKRLFIQLRTIPKTRVTIHKLELKTIS